MKNIPLISVIVPVYKVEKYINKCIDSIISQTYQNIQIILVDDGSPDECGMICDEYADKDKRIKVIHKENGGLSDARNAGIDIADGELIGFVDSDDFIASDMYEVLCRNLLDNNADIAMCCAQNIYDDDMTEKPYGNGQIQIFNVDEAINALYEGRLNNFAWNKLYKRHLFDDIRYPVGKIYEDLFTTYRLLDLCKRVILNTSRMYYYRIRSDSIMGVARKKINIDKFEAFNNMISHFKDRKVELAEAKLYMNRDLLSDVFKIIAAGTVKENKQFFDKLKAFINVFDKKNTKEYIGIWLAVNMLWLLRLRYTVCRLFRRR